VALIGIVRQSRSAAMEALKKANLELKRELEEERRKYAQLHREKVVILFALSHQKTQELQTQKEQFIKDKKQEISDAKSRMKIEHSIELENLKKDLAREKEFEIRAAKKKLEDQHQATLDKKQV
jgi:hypothetical protein